MESILELESARLVLRQWRDSDLTAFAGMCADPHVMRYFPAKLSRLESAALIGRIRGHFAEYGFGLWALQRKDSGEFIGLTGLQHVSFDAAFTQRSKLAGAWPASIGDWAMPARRRGLRCAVVSTVCSWMKSLPSPPKPICHHKKSCRP